MRFNRSLFVIVFALTFFVLSASVASAQTPAIPIKITGDVQVQVKVDAPQSPAAILATGANMTATIVDAFTNCMERMVMKFGVPYKEAIKPCERTADKQKSVTKNMADEASDAAKPQVVATPTYGSGGYGSVIYRNTSLDQYFYTIVGGTNKGGY